MEEWEKLLYPYPEMETKVPLRWYSPPQLERIALHSKIAGTLGDVLLRSLWKEFYLEVGLTHFFCCWSFL